MTSGCLGDALRQIDLLFGEGTVGGVSDAQLLERYVAHRDELAFEALLRRHGPMVLAVCRSVVNDPNDADDAFQATFLLFARKAKSLWVDGSLGGWLHRVAWRIASHMKDQVARRRDQERKAAERACPPCRSRPPWDDTSMVIHQEIARLPERYRKPIVLCYLENMTYQQAASHLNWSETTTQGRLARARSLLRNRLTRRGVTLAGFGLGTLAGPPGASAVSMAMLRAVVRAAYRFHLGEAAAVETVSTAADALMRRALRTMMIAKLKWVATAAVIMGGLTSVATGLAATGRVDRERPGAGFARTTQEAPNPSRTTAPAAAVPLGTDEETRLAFLGAPSDPIGGPIPDPVSFVEQVQPGETVNYTKDLKPRRRMDRGDSLFSPLGGFRLHMRQDGNLVLYVIDDERLPEDLHAVQAHAKETMDLYAAEIWSTGTNVPKDGAGVGSYCVMQEDGEFIVYDVDGKPCYRTNTPGHEGAFLRCQDDGNVVLYVRDPDLRPIWATNTTARRNRAAGP